MFAVLPFEIIYTRYVRVHSLANLFLALTIFATFQLLRKENIRQFRLIGGIVGLGMAARWTSIALLGIPAIASLWLQDWRAQGFRQSAARLLRIWLRIVAPAVMGAFILGNPAVILNLRAVLRAMHLIMSSADASQFSSVGSFLSLSKVAAMLAYTLPFGLGIPLLLLCAAALVVVVVGLRGKHRYTVPLLVYGASVVFAMGKGYSPIFVRAAILLFPVLAMFAAFAGWQIWSWLAGKRVGQWTFAVVVAVCLAATLFLDIDYGRAMSKGDPREDVYRFLQDEARGASVTVGLGPNDHGYFVVDPALTGANVRRVVLDDKVEAWPLNGIDYIVSGDLGSPDVDSRVPAVEFKLNASPRFTLVRKFDRKPVTLHAMERWLGRAPHDMLYPFPVLRIYRVEKNSIRPPLPNRAP